MIGNGDVHRLEQLGTTYSLVDAAPDADAICAAIAAGRVEVVARPHSPFTAGRLMADLALDSLRKLRAPDRPTPSPSLRQATETASGRQWPVKRALRAQGTIR